MRRVHVPYAACQGCVSGYPPGWGKWSRDATLVRFIFIFLFFCFGVVYNIPPAYTILGTVDISLLELPFAIYRVPVSCLVDLHGYLPAFAIYFCFGGISLIGWTNYCPR